MFTGCRRPNLLLIDSPKSWGLQGWTVLLSHSYIGSGIGCATVAWLYRIAQAASLCKKTGVLWGLLEYVQGHIIPEKLK
jgi:hypothetical protein